MTTINLKDFYAWYTHDEYIEVPDEVAEELVLRSERFFYLWNALNTLPEMQGRRVEACVIDGKSYSEMGRAEGVHSGSVRSSVLRGLENMKEYLKENW